MSSSASQTAGKQKGGGRSLAGLATSALARPWWHRITPRLILLILLVSTLPPLTLGVLVMRSSLVAQQAEVLERNLAVASLGVDKVESYLDNLVENMRLLIEVADFQALDPSKARPLLSFFLSFMEDVKDISLMDARGREQARIAENVVVTSQDLAERSDDPEFKVAASGDVYIGPVQASEFSEPFVSVALPIRSLRSDKVVGVLAARVNLKRLWDEVLSFKVGQGGYLYLVNKKGQLLAHPDFSLVLAQKDLSAAGAVQGFLRGEEEDKHPGGFRYVNYLGVEVLGVYKRIDKLGWGVIVEQSTADAFANVERMKIETSLILLNTVIVTLVLAMLSARRFTRPLADLAHGARALGAGNFDYRIPVGSGDEIGEVAERFNAMATQVRESFQRLHTVLETSTMISSSLELEQVLARALERMDRLSGQSLSGIVLLEGAFSGEGPASASIRTLDPSEGIRRIDLDPSGFGLLWRVLSSRQHLAVSDVASSASPGEQALWRTRGIEAVLMLPLVSKGELQGVLWIGRTSTGVPSDEEVTLGLTVANHVAIAIDNARLYDALRRTSAELESRVEERTLQLREAHEELVRSERLALIGQLAGGVGHELRNPLGAIGNAVYYLRMRLSGNEDAKVQKHLGILDAETRRSNRIVTSLLDFSRVKDPNRAPVDVHPIITGILARQAPEGSVAVVTDFAEPLPPAFVDADQITQVVVNLVQNAVEAMPDGGTMRIRTCAADGVVSVSVADTGIGISPENLDKIFQPLFTTKARGIGLGLAISRRLTEANGGRLKVESQIGVGSCFTLTLPIAGSPAQSHDEPAANSHR